MNIASIPESAASRMRQFFGLGGQPRYQHVDTAEPRNAGLRYVRNTVFVMLAVLILFIGVPLIFVQHGSNSSLEHEQAFSKAEIISPPGYLHLLVPVAHADDNLCKFMLSAAIMDYPEPTLLGWNRPNEERDSNGDGFTALEQAQAYLDKLDPVRDDDLVLVVEGNNHWFQLRPQILLNRYFEINRRADMRIRKQTGDKAAQKYNVKQNVVFAAQAECSPWSADDPACSIVPAPAESGKPRFLNPSMILGSVAAVRALYNETLVRRAKDHGVSLHEIFGQIFGNQEVYRQTLKSSRQDSPAIAASPDFGIGLDYDSAISLDAGAARDNVEWLKYSDRENGPTIHQDLERSLPPFWTFSTEVLPRDVNWSNVSLLTDVQSGAVPAMVRRDQLMGEAAWDRLWFQQHVRTLFNAHIYAPLGAIAVAGYDKPRYWWSPEDYRGGARDSDGEWVRYEDICSGTEEEVFRDGQGAWELPENH